MRQIKRVLELRDEHGLSIREIARSLGVPISTIGDYLQQAREAGLSWPLPEGLDERDLRERLRQEPEETEAQRPLPDWRQVRQELSRPKVTRRLVWEEYRREHPDGYGYSQFCERYRRWLDTLDPVLRQHHAPGEALLVDWAGQTIPVLDPNTGEERRASLFVATLGFSNFLYAEAFFDQKVGSWISAHIHAYEAIGGVPRLTVPDKPKTAVVKAAGAERMENACRRALHYEFCSYPQIKSILEHRLDEEHAETTSPARAAPPHANLRGPDYHQ